MDNFGEDKSRKEFNMYMDNLNRMYRQNPEFVTKETRDFLKTLEKKKTNNLLTYDENLNDSYEEELEFLADLDESEAIKRNKNKYRNDEDLSGSNKSSSELKKVFQDIDKDKLYLCVLIFLIALIGLFNIKAYPIYLFGIIFFLAGHFIGLYLKWMGLIFLFSHSVTGIFVMLSALIGDIVTNNPIMSDNPLNIIIYLVIVALLLIFATLMVIIHNLSDYLKTKKFFVVIPMSIYVVAFFMAGLLNIIFNFIYNL